MKIIWSPFSLSKLDDILEFIARDNVDAALALIDEFEERVKGLAAHPLKGRLVPSLNDELKRELIVRDNYLIVYEIQDNTIEILTIRHAKQDPDESNPDRK